MKDSTFEKYKLVIDEYLVNGMNGTKAYQKFYPKSSDETAKVRFSEIVTICNVSDYLKEKQMETSSKLNITRESQLKELQDLKNDPSVKVPEIVKIIEVQNKMLGLNEPDKVEVKTNNPIFTVNPFVQGNNGSE